MRIMWKDRSNSLGPRSAWGRISSKKASDYLKIYLKGEDYVDAELRLGLGQVVETPTFFLKE